MKPEANKPSRIPRAHEQKPALPSDSLVGAAQVFLDILDLHQGPGVYLVLAPSGEARQRLMAHWRNLAQTRGHRVVTVPYTSQSRAQDLLTLVGQTQERDVIFVDLDDELSWATANPTGLLPDLDQRVQQARQSLQSLNLARERLRRLPAPLFFWMSPEVLRAFARYAADLFAVRSGLLEVLELPPPTAAAALARVESKTLWPSRYAHLPREEREGRLRLLQEALDAEARRAEPRLYRLARYHLDAADLLGSLGQYKRALHHAQQALNLARKIDDPGLQADSWLAIGQWLAALGEDQEALQALEKVVQQHRLDRLLAAPDALTLALVAFLQAKTWAESRRVLEEHPELLSEQALALLERLVAEARNQGQDEAARYLEKHLDLLRRASQVGVGQAFAELAGPDLPAELRPLAQQANEAEARYRRTGDHQALDRAVALWEQILNHPALEQADARVRLAVLNDAGGAYLRRYWARGQVADLDRALALWQEAVRLTPEGSPDLPSILNNLALGLSDRYARTGDLQDLEQAIGYWQEAVRLTPEGSPDLAGRLNNLGNGLRARYARTGRLEDLEEAIRAYRQAVERTPPDSPDLPGFLNNLASGLRDRYARTGDLQDLEQAIGYWQETLRIPYLLSDLREKIQADIFQAVQNIEDEDARAELQAALAPYLPEEARLQRPDDEETRTTDAHRGERTDTDLSGS